MIDGKKVLAVIPARGGSKGVKNKNIRVVASKPLIAWTIEEANKSKYIDRLILSYDNADIISIAHEWGCEAPFIRPAELARDDTPGVMPIIHAIETFPDYELVVVLQPTSPLRLNTDIDGCISCCVNKNAPVAVSVVNSHSNPYWMFHLNQNGILKPFIDVPEISRRQDLPDAFSLNGAVYVAERNWLIDKKTFIGPETVAYEMPMDRSLDIDSQFDLDMCEFLLERSAIKA